MSLKQLTQLRRGDFWIYEVSSRNKQADFKNSEEDEKGECEENSRCNRIEKLEAPFSRPYEKLKGYSDVYRIRVGDYRIIYYVDKKGKIVLVLRVDLRKRVYKGL